MMEMQIRTSEIEKTFVQTHVDLHTIVTLDGIDIFSSPSGFRIRSHDRHGPLPHVWFETGDDARMVLRGVRRTACHLAAIVYIRDELAREAGLRFLHNRNLEPEPGDVEALLAGYRQLWQQTVQPGQR